MKTNFLTSATISEVLADETLDDSAKALRLAFISLYGPEAPNAIRQRAMAIGASAEAVTEELKGSTEVYPKGFFAAYLNKSLNSALN